MIAGSIGLGLVGALIAFIVRARNYIIDGTFDPAIWIKDNLYRLLWVFSLLILINVLIAYSPESLELLTDIGIKIDPNAKSVSVLVGLVLTQLIHTISKTKV